jgi:hypothetical protein
LPLEPHAVDFTAAACAAPFAARSAAKFAATSAETSVAELARAPGRVLLLAIPAQADRPPPWVPGLEFKSYVIRDVDCTTCCDDFDMTSKDGRRLWSSTCGVPTA